VRAGRRGSGVGGRLASGAQPAGKPCCWCVESGKRPKESECCRLRRLSAGRPRARPAFAYLPIGRHHAHCFAGAAGPQPHASLIGIGRFGPLLPALDRRPRLCVCAAPMCRSPPRGTRLIFRQDLVLGERTRLEGLLGSARARLASSARPIDQLAGLVLIVRVRGAIQLAPSSPPLGLGRAGRRERFLCVSN
jgi:hypothetical protein